MRVYLVKKPFSTEKLLKGKAEILPLIHPEKKYFAIHVTNVIDAINYDQAVVRQLKTGLRVGFEKYSFYKEKVEGEHIFRIYLDDRIQSKVFVTDQFKETVESNHLTGFKFIKVWDSENQCPLERDL